MLKCERISHLRARNCARFNTVYSTTNEVGPQQDTPEHANLQEEQGFGYCSILGELIYAYVACRPDIGYHIRQRTALPGQWSGSCCLTLNTRIKTPRIKEVGPVKPVNTDFPYPTEIKELDIPEMTAEIICASVREGAPGVPAAPAPVVPRTTVTEQRKCSLSS